MTRQRFYAPPGAFSAAHVTLAADEARHLRDVLRLQLGDELYVFDGEGKEFECVVEEAARDSVLLRVVAEVSPARPESPLHLTLAVALLKGEKFDLVVQKATELGVARIVPVITRRADVKLRDEHDAAKRVARWQRIALEAAKQSGRARVPVVNGPVTLESLLQNPGVVEVAQPAFNETLRLMFSERDGAALAAVVRDPYQPQSVIALTGSEGGWTDEEIAEARANEWKIATLGGRILRAETAAIAVTALLQHRFGDLL